MIEQTKSKIKDFILQEFLPGEDPALLTDSTPLITGGVLDSVATLRLLLFLEQEFGIKLSAHETGPEYLDTVGSIADLVNSKKV